MATRKTTYSESSIRVLKGLEPVRQRPGMYTRTDNPLHIIQEVIDNSSDEALGGALHAYHCFAKCRWQHQLSTMTAAAFRLACIRKKTFRRSKSSFTRLHAGGKFDKGADGAYAFSGGLHGVGVVRYQRLVIATGNYGLA